jgi:transposase
MCAWWRRSRILSSGGGQKVKYRRCRQHAEPGGDEGRADHDRCPAIAGCRIRAPGSRCPSSYASIVHWRAIKALASPISTRSASPDALIGDKAYDADPFVDTLTQREIAPVIPPKTNRKVQRACDFALYCERNLIERRFFNQLKHFRAIATRYDKLARNFLAGYSWPRLQSCSTEDRT